MVLLCRGRNPGGGRGRAKTLEIQRLRPPRNRGVDGRRLPQPSRDPEAQQIAYRVEITGTEALPDVVKTVITEAAEGCELSRVGQQLFVVGMFDDKAVADRVAAAIIQADPSLEIKVAEIAE